MHLWNDWLGLEVHHTARKRSTNDWPIGRLESDLSLAGSRLWWVLKPGCQAIADHDRDDEALRVQGQVSKIQRPGLRSGPVPTVWLWVSHQAFLSSCRCAKVRTNNLSLFPIHKLLWFWTIYYLDYAQKTVTGLGNNIFLFPFSWSSRY